MTVARRIIPCLDVRAGRVVKGIRFENIRDAGEPVACARAYDAAGADELCFLDITASHEQRGIMLDVVRRTADALMIPLTVGGGIRSRSDVDELLRAGADKISINTAVVTQPELINAVANAYGVQVLVVAIDAKRVENHWEVFTHGGRKPTGLDVVAWARECADRGAGEILLTSMDRDGTGIGYDIPLLQAVTQAVSVPVIASGGVGNLSHLADGLRDVSDGGGGAEAVLAATIFHDGHHTIGAAKQYLQSVGIHVRPYQSVA